MGARGRQSADAAAVVIPGNFGQRAEPPAELTPEEAAIWRETVASEATDAFNTAALRGLLKDYCRHRAASESVSQIINSFKSEWLKSADGAKRYRELLKIRDLECRASADKATKLRLTNQSRYTPHGAATAARRASKTAMPWDFDGEEK